MRDDVVEILYSEMEPALRAMIAYESNGAFDVRAAQSIIDRLRRESPVVRWDMGVGFFLMDDVVAAGRHPALVSSHPDTWLPLGMGSRGPLPPLHVDGEEHRRYRRLLDPLLAPKKVAPMESEIRKLADELIEGFVADGRVELHDAFCVPLPSTIFLTLFGMPLADMDFLVAMKDRILKNEGTTMEEKDAIGVEAGDRMRERLRQRLDERRREGAPRDDLIGEFMSFELDGERLSDDEIVNIMHLFTIAGLDTVTSSLSCLFAWFAAHPDERRRVVADPSMLPAAIEELMRFESPVPASGPRWATEDTEINGVPVRRGEMVFLCWASANVDPATFESPLEVRLDRPANRHIAFASGVHRCLGSHLARLELRTAVDQFHRRIPDYWITPGEEPRYELAGVRQARYLPVTFTAAR
ncbi:MULTISPECIES: cytochrome P450 [unclassified Frankia]|uniref:cytochrome P450 n=1 Tax=unclassified Frankia TaxID=2632575 RepID=UPI002AD2BE15|nr:MULTISPECIES: cytochrome P450 [unclassified Frankia]